MCAGETCLKRPPTLKFDDIGPEPENSLEDGEDDSNNNNNEKDDSDAAESESSNEETEQEQPEPKKHRHDVITPTKATQPVKSAQLC